MFTRTGTDPGPYRRRWCDTAGNPRDHVVRLSLDPLTPLLVGCGGLDAGQVAGESSVQQSLHQPRVGRVAQHMAYGEQNAGRIDGMNEYAIFLRLVLPLVRPAMATVAVFNMIPIWNDLWFPLILAPGESTKTLTLGSQVFIGQFVTDWNAVLSALSLAILPVLVLYVIFSRQLIRGITSGAVK